MADVLLKGIKKSYGSVDVIKGVDIEINDGEFVVFVGPSGCGKSTLLRMIAGLEDITGGTLEIGGRVVNEVQAKDRGIAMVFQSYAIFPHMTVRENVAFGLTIAKASKAEKEEKVAEAARILQMEHLLDRRPSQLSGGQRQRVAIGRADRAPPGGVPVRRAAVQPRRGAAARHADGDRQAAQVARRDDGLCHP